MAYSLSFSRSFARTHSHTYTLSLTFFVARDAKGRPFGVDEGVFYTSFVSLVLEVFGGGDVVDFDENGKNLLKDASCRDSNVLTTKSQIDEIDLKFKIFLLHLFYCALTSYFLDTGIEIAAEATFNESESGF